MAFITAARASWPCRELDTLAEMSGAGAAYPVALALFSTIIAPYVDRLGVADMPILMGSALIGFLLADATLIFAAGLPMVRRFFLRHGRILTRFVGLLFIGFGARSIFDAASSAMRRA